jgi:hypothetical protein
VGDGHLGVRGDDLYGGMAVAPGGSVDRCDEPGPDGYEAAPVGAALSHRHVRCDLHRSTSRALTRRYPPLSSLYAVTFITMGYAIHERRPGGGSAGAGRVG